jgi:hypothetical protein
MRIQGLAGTAGAVVLVLSGVAGVEAGIRTDRLSGKRLEAWRSIVAIVVAEDRAGRPLHPALRGLWDTVETSSHAVYVELPESKNLRSYVAGRFAVTKIDPEGKAHEAVLVLNLPVIDRISTRPGAARANGFIPLAGLGKKQRYAEVLGHELAHAAWTFAEADRAGLAKPFSGAAEELVRESREDGGEVDRISRQVEGPAEAAEQEIWAELLAGQRTR